MATRRVRRLGEWRRRGRQGVDARSGRVVATLTTGHEAGSKVRDVCAGLDAGGSEWVLSGGFDRRVVLWRVGDGEGDVDGS